MCLIAIGFGLPAFGLDPKLPPGKNFDWLSAFKLQTMTASLAFVEVKAETLVNGFTSKYFYTDSTDGSMVFFTPSNGGTSGGSQYPRTELRQTGFGANWKLTDTTTYVMTASCKVTKAPSANPTVTIGQVHGSADNSELVELEWNGNSAGNCKVSAMFQTNNSAGSNYFVQLAGGLSLGSLVTYEFQMKKGVLTVTVNGKSGTQTYTTQYYGTTDGYYFKAGNYLQYSSSSASAVSEVKFYSLELSSTAPKPPTSIQTKIHTNQFASNEAASCVSINSVQNNTFDLNATAKLFDVCGRHIAYINQGSSRKLPAGFYFSKTMNPLEKK